MAKKSFLIAGLGRFGRSLALTLARMNHDVLAIDQNEEKVALVADQVTHAMIADLTEERVVSQLGVEHFDAVILAIGDDFHAALLMAVLMKEQGAKRIISKAADNRQAQLLKRIGADEVIQPERESGARLARLLSNDDIFGFIELSDTYSITELRVPEIWIGKRIGELNVRAHYGVNIIAVQRRAEMFVTLGPQFLFEEHDEVVFLGDNKALARIETL